MVGHTVAECCLTEQCRGQPLGLLLQIRCMVGQVMATKVQLTFSQLQNFMGQLALDLQLTFYFWGHTDVAVLPSNASSSFSEEVLRCIAVAASSDEGWPSVMVGALKLYCGQMYPCMTRAQLTKAE